jgi:hypothetical protein
MSAARIAERPREPTPGELLAVRPPESQASGPLHACPRCRRLVDTLPLVSIGDVLTSLVARRCRCCIAETRREALLIVEELDEGAA